LYVLFDDPVPPTFREQPANVCLLGTFIPHFAGRPLEPNHSVLCEQLRRSVAP
jgi:hypothetical protein